MAERAAGSEHQGPRGLFPPWLLTARVTPTPAQLARLDGALAAVDDQGQPARPTCSRDCRR